jgi:hypothetical protein
MMRALRAILAIGGMSPMKLEPSAAERHFSGQRMENNYHILVQRLMEPIGVGRRPELKPRAHQCRH